MKETLRSDRFMLFGLPGSARDVRGLYWFIAVYLGAFAVAAMLAPWFYQLSLQLGEGKPESTFWGYLASKDFPRFVDRTRFLAAAASLVWLIGYCRLWGRFGFDWRPCGYRVLLVWMGVGLATMALMIALQAMFLSVQLREEVDFGRVAEVIAGALAGALILSWLEESIFRGMLFRMFYTAMSTVPAVLLSAVLFAAMHFKKVRLPEDLVVEWWTGWLVAWKSLTAIWFTFDFFQAVNLFLAGVILNLLFLRKGRLIPCLGLHAGWVLGRNSWGKLTVSGDESLRFWLGGGGVIDGVLPVFILSALAAWLWFDWRKNGTAA